MNRQSTDQDQPWYLIFHQIDKAEFTARSLSWIYSDKKYVFKITKYSDSIADDLINPQAIQDSREEYEQLLFLSQLDSAVLKPLGLIGACIVLPYLAGNDLVDESSSIRVKSNLKKFRDEIKEGLALCARLHKYSSDTFADLPKYDYEKHDFLPLKDRNLIKRLYDHQKTIVVQGFEIRNFRQDSLHDKIMFFDPHHVYIGAPEEDFTRYIISLLMINWGQNFNFLIWNKFNYTELLSFYEKTRGDCLDRVILSYMFSLNLEMRKGHAMTSIKQMGFPKSLIAFIYFKLFFLQVFFWRKSNNV